MAIKKNYNNHENNEIDIDLGYFVPYLISDLNQHFQRVLTNALEPLGLIVPEWRALITIKRLGACTINEIVNFTELPQSTVSRTITNLHSKGLVQRSWSAEDNRVAEIRLSALGRTQLGKSITAAVEASQAEVDLLALDEAEHWIDIMRTVLGRVKKDKSHNI